MATDDALQLPEPATTGFTFPGSMFKYELQGEWDATCAQQQREALANYNEEMKQYLELPIEVHREMIEQEFTTLMNKLDDLQSQQRVSREQGTTGAGA